MLCFFFFNRNGGNRCVSPGFGGGGKALCARLLCLQGAKAERVHPARRSGTGSRNRRTFYYLFMGLFGFFLIFVFDTRVSCFPAPSGNSLTVACVNPPALYFLPTGSRGFKEKRRVSGESSSLHVVGLCLCSSRPQGSQDYVGDRQISVNELNTWIHKNSSGMRVGKAL